MNSQSLPHDDDDKFDHTHLDENIIKAFKMGKSDECLKFERTCREFLKSDE